MSLVIYSLAFPYLFPFDDTKRSCLRGQFDESVIFCSHNGTEEQWSERKRHCWALGAGRWRVYLMTVSISRAIALWMRGSSASVGSLNRSCERA